MKKIKDIVSAICLFFLFLNPALTQNAAILPQGKTQFLDNNGNPLSSGKVFFYIPSTTTFKTTWQDTGKTTPNTNPVILDAGGRAIIYGDGTYRQLVRTSANVTIFDAVTASAGTGGGTTGTGDGDLVGTVKPWAGLVAPNQYVFAYGQEISRATYAAYFTATTLNQNISCTSASPILTGLSDTSQIPNGSVLEATCIAAGSTVLSKTSTTVTMNNNASLTTSTTGVFFLYGNGNGSTTFNVPDLRGYAVVGRNNMGGTNGLQLSTVGMGGPNPNATGAKGGSETVTLTTPNFPPYTPSGTIGNVTAAGTISTPTITMSPSANSVVNSGTGSSANLTGGGGALNQAAITATSSTPTFTGSAVSGGIFTGTAQGGTSTPLRIVQPTQTLNYIIKITPDQNSADASGVTSLGLMTGDIACGSGVTCTGNIISLSGGANPWNSDANGINYGGNVGIGVTSAATSRIDIRPTQTITGSRIFAISNTENGRVNSTPGPIELTWGASNGSAWDATVIGTNANVVTMTTYAKQDTFDFVPFQLTGHLTAGTGSGIVGHRVQAYIDSTAITPRGGTGLEVLMRNDTSVGDTWGLNVGVSNTVSSTTSAMHGIEYDMEARGLNIKYKFGTVVGSTQNDVAIVTGTLAVNGTADTVPGSAAYWVTSFGGGAPGSAIGFDSALLTMKEAAGGGTPITGRLWYAGGFTVPNGLDWGRMGFSDSAIKLPNNGPVKFYNAAGAATLKVLNLNSSNLIEIGTGATVNPTSGAASLGGSTITNASMNGSAGNGYLELTPQSASATTGGANTVRLFSTASGQFAWKGANGFISLLSTTSNTADRGYTFPDVSGTLALASNAVWTPTDGSGAGLAFTSVSANYSRVGNMVFAYALLVYPATASGSNAVISGFPVPTPNQNYAQNPCGFFSASSITNAYSMRMDPNASTAHIFNNAGGSTTNAQLSGSAVIFSCTYPAT